MAWIKTKYAGVRYREHKIRKYNGEPDKYFAMRYMHTGKQVEEGCGWSSEGMTAKKASDRRGILCHANRTGEGYGTMRERRNAEAVRREAEHIKRQLTEKENVPFADYFTDVYMPIAKSYKTSQTIDTEMSMLKKRLKPTLGNLPLKDISAFHIEKLKKALIDKGLSARSIQYTLAVFRQVWNHARRSGYVSGDSPTLSVKVAKVDNKRQRFLNHDEAAQLLKSLRLKSQQVHDIALLSLNTGLRASEIFTLCWGRVDMLREQIQVVDTKSKRNRVAYMTSDVKALFSRLQSEDQKPTTLVFPDAKGKRIVSISSTFEKTVKALGFNNGIEDPRQRLVFHSLRHTFASWLVENGTDLYIVRELLGHSTITLTERYSHLSDSTLKAAVKRFEAVV